MTDMETIIALRRKIGIRPWANGKMLLISADERVKNEMLRMRAEENSPLELLTDPEFRVTDEDMEGTMLVIADPKRMAIVFDIEAGQLHFVDCYTEEETGDE